MRISVNNGKLNRDKKNQKKGTPAHFVIPCDRYHDGRAGRIFMVIQHDGGQWLDIWQIKCKGKTPVSSKEKALKPNDFKAFSMVLKAGFEPARLAAGDFKSPVSAIPPFQPTRLILYAVWGAM